LKEVGTLLHKDANAQCKRHLIFYYTEKGSNKIVYKLDFEKYAVTKK